VTARCFPRTSILALLALLGSAPFTGCGPKYKPLTVDEVNFHDPKSTATITLSDPQIYSRETLVNDRRREAKYLLALLEKSVNETFEPQIRRDLRTLTSTVLTLQGSFNPLAGRQAERTDSLAEIDARVAETDALKRLAEARIGLVEAQRKLEDLAERQEALSRIGSLTTGSDGGGGDGGGDGDDDSGDDDGGGDGEGGGGGGTTPGNPQQQIDGEVKLLRANVDDLKKQIDALPSTAQVRQTAVGATPREVFRDRQAYRAELRGALAEVELDDAHDQEQSSLYRLQFHATVLPGQHQDKMGVARLTLRPPELERYHVLELYKTWLGHVTYRLNQTVEDGLHHDASYLLLGMGLDKSLFHSTTFRLANGEKLLVALPPTIYVRWKKVTGSEKDLTKMVERVEKLIRGISAKCRRCCEKEQARSLLLRLSTIEPFISASIRGLGDINSIDREFADELRQLIDFVVNGSEVLDRLRRQNRSCFDGVKLGSSIEKQWNAVPATFKGALVDTKDPSEGAFGIARGRADVYATAPVELAQQISTTLSAFRSFEVALSLAAALPTKGVGANAGLNRMRAMRTDIEARERLPLVVGFAERNTAQDPQFGWIFGPQAMLDAKNKRLRLRRPAVNYPVTADLSIPGWWPHVDLELETGWVGDWHGGAILEECPEEERDPKAGKKLCSTQETFPVHLPLNRADLDGLTEYLAKKTVGGALAYTSIAGVSPKAISTCADSVTFLVYGANVWRSTSAFLNGLEAKEIRVLPDMGGLAVTFEGIRKSLPQVPGANGEAVLTVWTRNGASSRKVTVVEPKKAGLTCGPVKEPSLKLAVRSRPLIPTKDKTTATTQIAAVQGKLPGAYDKLGISVRPTKPIDQAGHLAGWSALLDKSAKVDGKVLEDVVELKDFSLQTGDSLQVSLVEVPVPGAEPKRHTVEGSVVYYKPEKDSQIQVDETVITDLETPVKLTLPYRYDLAYPVLKDGRVTFGVEIQGNAGDYKISFSNPTPSKLPPAKEKTVEKRTIKLKLVVRQGDKVLATEKEKTALLAKPRTLEVTVSVKGAESWQLPKVVGKVNLGKGAGAKQDKAKDQK